MKNISQKLGNLTFIHMQECPHHSQNTTNGSGQWPAAQPISNRPILTEPTKSTSFFFFFPILFLLNPSTGLNISKIYKVEDWESALDCPDLLVQFEEKCGEAGETELYFLLSAFANMAMSRGREDCRFVTFEIFTLSSIICTQVH